MFNKIKALLGPNGPVTAPDSRPDFSIIVVAFNMQRELPRTLHSLSRVYQRDIEQLSYEVVVVDNGSAEPVPAEQLQAYGPEFRLLRIDNASPSPAPAVNAGAASARGKHLCLLVDGARMVTPGVLHWAHRAFQQDPRAVVSTPGFHLGPDLQRISSQHGYHQAMEDALLAHIHWPEDGYKLFEIASLASSSASAWSGPLAESNCVFVPRALYAELAGFDERFDSPGGGMVNLDFYKRACEAANVEMVYLVGEGSFHQIHGGITTGGNTAQVKKFETMHEEYQAIRGQEFRVPQQQPILLGRSQIGSNWLGARGANNIISKYKLLELRNKHFTETGYDPQKLVSE